MSRPPRTYVARHLVDVPRSGIRDFFDIVSAKRGVISLGIGEPDFDTPWHVRESTVYWLEKGATRYTSNLGLLELREAIAGYVKRTFGAGYDPAREIIVTVGVSEALDLAVRATVDVGDEVIYHEPCYVSYPAVIRLVHGVPVAIETKAENDFYLSAAEVRRKIGPKTKAIIINFPNNPTGATLGREDLEGIAKLARDHDLLVISDEIYAELTYEGEHVSIASLPGMKERTILLHGFSKAFAMTGFRLGYACSTPELIEAMMKIHQYTMLCAPTPSQKGAIEALSDPDSDIAEMREEYRRRRNFALSALGAMGLACSKPRGAFYLFPCIASTGLSSRDFALRLLEEENVAVVPGTAFGPSGEGHVRCSYATSFENLKEAVRRMERFLSRARPRVQA